MKNKIRFKKRNFIFIFISIFFYCFMIILFWNLSFMMFRNAAILIVTENSKVLKEIIKTNLNLFPKNDDLHNIIINTTINFNIQTFIKYLIIHDNNGNILYSYGQKESLKDLLYFDIQEEDRLFSKFIDKEIYQISFIITKKDKIYFNIIYDLSDISRNYFQNKREIFLVVSILNFMILFFLSIMILNLQRRLIVKEEYINELKTTDELTGLLNKEHFLKLFKKEAERAQRTGINITLLTIDIDNFLNINEKYGYEFGTIVLQTVSKIFESSFRSFDIIGRFGDDEFTVLMIDADENAGFEAGERCRIAIEENKFYYEARNEITITVSIGVADFKTVSENMKKNPSESGKNFFRSIIFNSLNALARAKRDGRNKVIKYSKL